MGYLKPRKRGLAWLFTETPYPAYVMSTVAIIISLYILFGF